MLAKSLWGENGKEMTEEEAGAIAWSMMNRFLLVDYRWQKAGWSFERFITEFSQPVNPDWLDPSGALCQRWPEHCTPAKISRRRTIQVASWKTVQRVSPDGVKYAQAFQEGDLPNPFPEPVYDFAAASVVVRQNRPGPGINIGGNVFIRYEDLKPEELKYVIPGEVHTGAAAYKAAWAAVAFAALGAGSAWLLERYGEDILEFTKKYIKRG
jgi:hypothetical protein